MTAKQAAAGLILGTVVPVAIGGALDQYDDSVVRAWKRGALVLGLAAALGWAADELGRTPAT